MAESIYTDIIDLGDSINASLRLANDAINALLGFLEESSAEGTHDSTSADGGAGPSAPSDLGGWGPGDIGLVYQWFEDFEALPGIDTDFGLADMPLPALPIQVMSPPEEIIDVARIAKYASSLLEGIKTRLSSYILYGGTGFPEEVENAIYEQDKELQLAKRENEKEAIIDAWAKRGFDLPNGLITAPLNEMEKNFLQKQIDRSLDIAFKQADLELHNKYTALDLAVNLESQLMTAHVQFQNIFLATLMALQNAKIAIVEVWGELYKAYVGAVKNYYDAVQTMVNAQIEIGQSLIRRLKAKVEGVKSAVLAEMERISALLKFYEIAVTAVRLQARGFEAEGNVRVANEGASLRLGAARRRVAAKNRAMRESISIAQKDIASSIAEAAAHASAQLSASTMAVQSVSIGEHLSQTTSKHASATASETFKYNVP